MNTTPPKTDAPGTDEPERERGLKRWSGIFESSILRLAAVATALTVICGSAYGAYRWLDNTTKTRSPAPAPELTATISQVSVLPGQPLKTFIATLSPNARFVTKLPAAEKQGLLRLNGVTIDFTLSLVGPPGQGLHFAETLYTAGYRLVPEVPPLIPGNAVVSRATRDSGPGTVWVAYPSRPGRYVVRLTLLDATGHAAARAFTPVIHVPTGETNK